MTATIFVDDGGEPIAGSDSRAHGREEAPTRQGGPVVEANQKKKKKKYRETEADKKNQSASEQKSDPSCAELALTRCSSLCLFRQATPKKGALGRVVHSSGLGGTGRRGYECIRPPSPRHAGWTPPRRPVRTLRAFVCDAPEAWSWPKAPGQIEVGAIRRGYFCPGKKKCRGIFFVGVVGAPLCGAWVGAARRTCRSNGRTRRRFHSRDARAPFWPRRASAGPAR